jgi:hypothetical protein
LSHSWSPYDLILGFYRRPSETNRIYSKREGSAILKGYAPKITRQTEPVLSANCSPKVSVPDVHMRKKGGVSPHQGDTRQAKGWREEDRPGQRVQGIPTNALHGNWIA